MESLNLIFSYYDKVTANFSPSVQALVALLLLAVLVWQIWMIIKSGHWIFIATLIILLPGTWPAVRQIGNFVWLAIKFLLIRLQLMA